MFRSTKNSQKRNEDVKKSAGKVLDTKKDTATRAKHLRVFIDNSETSDIQKFFDNYYSHVYTIVNEQFAHTEQNLRLKGVHKAQKEELEAALYLVEKIFIYLPESLSQKWQFHSILRLLSKLLHPGNSWKLLKREAMRLFILWYSSLGEQADEEIHAIFATLVPGFTSPYPNLGLTALATQSIDPVSGEGASAAILPIIPPPAGERFKSNGNDITRAFNDVLLELMVSQVVLVEWREDKYNKQKKAFSFLLQRYKMYYIPTIFPNFKWDMSLFKPSLELPEVRKFRPNFIDTGDGTKKMDPMLACRVVVIKWIAQYTHLTRSGHNTTMEESHNTSAILNISGTSQVGIHERLGMSPSEDGYKNTIEGSMVREVLYASRTNVNFVHEVYRQAFLLSFSYSPAMKKVITVYKDWIQMNVQEVPPFLLEPSHSDRGEDSYYKDDLDSSQYGRSAGYLSTVQREPTSVRAGLQNLLQLFVTNAANVFLLEVSPEYPILLEEQVEMCKRVLNIYRFMVMNVKMDGRTWEQLLFILLQITQLTLTETPPRRREDTLGGRLAQAIFQTLIVTWIKANLYVVVSCELWDQFLEVLSGLTLWEELIREWFKTMETLTRVLARQVYNLDLNDLPLDRLSEQKQKRRRGKQGIALPKLPTTVEERKEMVECVTGGGGHPAFRGSVTEHGSPFPQRHSDSGGGLQLTDPGSSGGYHDSGGRHGSGNRSFQYNRIAMKQRWYSESSINFSRPMEEELLIAAAWRLKHRRSRSLDSLRSRYGDRGDRSRSHSPAHSSSMESHSIKDSPIQLDHDTVSEGAFSELGDFSLGSSQVPKSVMAGGTVKGWLPDVAVVLWRRMLGSLGDVNSIADTVIHAQIYKYLIDLYDIMNKIRANQGVSVDNLNTPPSPQYVPPFTIFAPWCFRALLLPDTYQRGRMYALRLLCLVTVRPQDTPLPRTHLIQFYKVLHQGLCCGDPDTVHTLVRFTGSRFFSLMLPGYTMFLYDYLAAANSVISSQEFKGLPRTEAVSIVGSLLPYPSVVSSLPLLMPAAEQLSLVSSQDLQDQVISVLLKAGKKEPNGLARCIALSSLGTFVYRELVHQTYHPKLKDAIIVLLAALKFNNKAVAQVASDMLLLISEQVDRVLAYHQDLPKRIVEVLSRSLAALLPKPEAANQISKEDRRLLLSLLSCLGEWCMKLPIPALIQPQEDSKSLLNHVFEALLSGLRSPSSNLSSPSSMPTSPGNSTPGGSGSGYVDGFDPDIHVDNLKGEQTWNSSVAASPIKLKSRSGSRDVLLDDVSLPLLQDEGPGSVVQLAARTLLSHLVNHLNHFPQAVGASSLSSQVYEHDDVPALLNGDLNLDTFMSPNIQMFILNNTTLLSLVEIPGLEEDFEMSGFTTAQTQVRILLRDISGKFVWDTSVLYTPGQVRVPPPSWEGVSSSHTSQPQGSSVLSPPRHTKRHRHPEELPTFEGTADDLDQLDDLLQYLGHTSPELLSSPNLPLNSVPPWQGAKSTMEGEIISSVIGERKIEQEHVQRLGLGGGGVVGNSQAAARISGRPAHPPDYTIQDNNGELGFQQARILFQQLGLSSWEKRPHIQLVNKSEQLVREIKNLDNQKGRETHKIAVIYVAEGQEDKISILSNTSGSQAFEEFVAGLGWEVELETHTGFIGGLTRNKTTGETAPYFANSFTEIMFHVSTRMNSVSEESMLQKTRHLGNDEIHIVWSEHWRDYRRGIIPTEFCDVLVVIYPLKNKLYRIQVIRKPEVPFFGPLFNEMIVDHGVLPGLVRATAVNASRAKRAMMSAYKTYYEERARALDQIIEKFKQPTTFEDFVSHVFAPSQPAHIIQGNMKVSGISSSTLSSATSSTTVQLTDTDDTPLPTPDTSYRPRSHTELGERTRSTLTEAWNRVSQDFNDKKSEVVDHLPLKKKLSSSGPGMVVLAQGNTGQGYHSNQHPSVQQHLYQQQQQQYNYDQGVHPSSQSGVGVHPGSHYTHIPLSDDEDSGSTPLPSARKISTKSPLAPTISTGRRPLAMRQNSGGTTGGPVTRKR